MKDEDITLYTIETCHHCGHRYTERECPRCEALDTVPVKYLLGLYEHVAYKLEQRGQAILDLFRSRPDLPRDYYGVRTLTEVGWYYGIALGSYHKTERTTHKGEPCVVLHSRQSFRGEYDYGTFFIPEAVYDAGPQAVLQWAQGVEAEYVLAVREEEERKQAKLAQQRDAQERRLYETLKQKFEGTP